MDIVDFVVEKCKEFIAFLSSEGVGYGVHGFEQFVDCGEEYSGVATA